MTDSRGRFKRHLAQHTMGVRLIHLIQRVKSPRYFIYKDKNLRCQELIYFYVRTSSLTSTSTLGKQELPEVTAEKNKCLKTMQ